jgi:hypothetical protein
MAALAADLGVMRSQSDTRGPAMNARAVVGSGLTALWLLLTTLAEPALPGYSPVRVDELRDGALCLPSGKGEMACWSRPTAEWTWLRQEHGLAYLCQRPGAGNGFQLHPSSGRGLTPAAVADDLQHRIGKAGPPHVSAISAAASDRPARASVRYQYTLAWSDGSQTTAVGYVTPSGWVTEAQFSGRVEPREFLEFVDTYRT